MSALSVRVRLFSTLLEDRVLPVREPVRLGEAEGALIPFPGADLVVWRGADGRLRVRGHALEPGAPVRIHLGPVEVELEAREPAASRWHGGLERWLGGGAPVPDVRLFLATASLALAAAFWETAGAFLDNDPEAAATIAALWSEPDRRAAPDARNVVADQDLARLRAAGDPLDRPPVSFTP